MLTHKPHMGSWSRRGGNLAELLKKMKGPVTSPSRQHPISNVGRVMRKVSKDEADRDIVFACQYLFASFFPWCRNTPEP